MKHLVNPFTILIVALLASGGCTRESTRLALRAQQRADTIDHAVFERQHQSLRILLYRDLLHRLQQINDVHSRQFTTALNKAWNERDLLDFWARQHERSRALRHLGVTTYLTSRQATLDLLIKAATANFNRLRAGIAHAAAQQQFNSPPPDSDPPHTPNTGALP